MEYKYLTQDARDEAVVNALISRETEHYHYDLNRANYESMLAAPDMVALPAEWPEALTKYKTLVGESLAQVVSGADYDLVVKLQFRDRVRLLLATTIAERGKVETIYSAISKQLTDKTRLESAKARIDAGVVAVESVAVRGG